MSTTVTITVRGLARTVQDLRALPEALRNKVIHSAMYDAIQAIQMAAQRMAPVHYGVLADHIIRRVSKKDGGATFQGRVGIDASASEEVGVRTRGRHEGEAIIEKPVSYAHFVEFGTVKAGAHPFLRPALDEQGNNTVQRFANNMAEKLDAIVESIHYL